MTLSKNFVIISQSDKITVGQMDDFIKNGMSMIGNNKWTCFFEPDADETLKREILNLIKYNPKLDEYYIH
jgi:hypothetical protein